MDNEIFLGVNDVLKREDGKTFSVAEQEFDPSFWAGLQWARDQQHKHARLKEYHHIASIPAIFVHKWLVQGFNVYEASKEEIMKRLYLDGLDAFVATEKRVI